MGERPYDLLIVGAGPAGLAAARAALYGGLRFVVLERAAIAQTLRDYPLGKPLHSPAADVELAWGELDCFDPARPVREEVLAHYVAFVLDHDLPVRTGETVQSIQRAGNVLEVHSDTGMYRARRVLAATGGFGVPRLLGVPGEHPGRVSYRFCEGASCAGRPVLVVGGGNSAAEAALYLHEAGARVVLSLRRRSFAPRGGVGDLFTSVKTFNSRRLEALATQGAIRVLYTSVVTGIGPETATVRLEATGETLSVPCARVFALLGAEPDAHLLREAGADIGSDGRPLYDPLSYETTVPGLHVAGHLTRELHIPNALRLAPRIVYRMVSGGAPNTGPAVAVELLARAAQTARRKSGLARSLIRRHAALRRAVQAIDRHIAMRTQPSAARALLAGLAHPRRSLRFLGRYGVARLGFRTS